MVEGNQLRFDVAAFESDARGGWHERGVMGDGVMGDKVIFDTFYVLRFTFHVSMEDCNGTGTDRFIGCGSSMARFTGGSLRAGAGGRGRRAGRPERGHLTRFVSEIFPARRAAPFGTITRRARRGVPLDAVMITARTPITSSRRWNAIDAGCHVRSRSRW